MENRVLKFKKMPVLCVCSSTRDANLIIEASKRASTNKEFVLVFDKGEKLAKRVLPAYVNARIRIEEGIARSESMQIEMLLLLSGTMNIGRALRECGMRSSNGFMLFATSRKLLQRFTKANGIRIEKRVRLELDIVASASVAATELLND